MTINVSPIATKLRGDIADTIIAEILTLNMQDGAGTNIATDGSLNLGTLPTMAMVGTNGLWANAGWMTSSGDNYIIQHNDAEIDDFFDFETKLTKGFLILFDIYKPTIVVQNSGIFAYGKNGITDNAQGAIQLTLGTTQKFTMNSYLSDGVDSTLQQMTATKALADATKYTVGVFFDYENQSQSLYLDDGNTFDGAVPDVSDVLVMIGRNKQVPAIEGFTLWGRSTTTTPAIIAQSGIRMSQTKFITFASDMSGSIGQIVRDQYNMPWDYSWKMEGAS